MTWHLETSLAPNHACVLLVYMKFVWYSINHIAKHASETLPIISGAKTRGGMYVFYNGLEIKDVYYTTL